MSIALVWLADSCYTLDKSPKGLFFKGVIMANVTRIKAKDSGPEKRDGEEKVIRKVSVKAKNTSNKKLAEKKAAELAEAKAAKSQEKKQAKAEVKEKLAKMSKSEKKAYKAKQKEAKKEAKRKNPGYFRGSVQEIRQVRWPNRKETWKLTVSVIVYVAIFMVAFALLDAGLTFIFNQVIGG